MSIDDATHYHCRCGELFPIEEALVRNCPEPVEFWGATAVRQGFEVMCPHCGDDQPEPCFMCELCGIRRATEEGTGLCNPCFVQNEAEQDANVARCKELEKELNKPFHDWTESRESEFHDYFTNV
jgi:hypothetical protein